MFFLGEVQSFWNASTPGTDHRSLLDDLDISGKICMICSSCFLVKAVRSARSSTCYLGWISTDLGPTQQILTADARVSVDDLLIDDLYDVDHDLSEVWKASEI